MLKLKPEVRFANPLQALSVILQVAESVFKLYGKDAVVSSLGDGKHKVGSFHPLGLAVDLRSKHLSTSADKHAVVKIMKDCLPQCDILLEYEGEDREHIHAEWDPK